MKKGSTPRKASSRLILATPQTTLSTVPTGGVIRPMALFMMNITPKYTGSMPALSTTGISTGVRISTVGVKSSAVPTITTMTIITAISRILLSMKGLSMFATSVGMLATVISQALTIAAATRNITIEVVLPAASTSP